MIYDCDICQKKENCRLYKINSKYYNELVCLEYKEIDAIHLAEYIIKHFCKDERRQDLWFEVEISLYRARRAAEILKDKGVDVGFFQHCSCLTDYNNGIATHAFAQILDQEEFDLLKRELC